MPNDITSEKPSSHNEVGVPRAVDDHIRIYTDGSALGNGKAVAAAGIGVYFGPSDPR